MNIEFKRLSEVNKSAIVDLMNNPLVRRHMPLASGYFSPQDCELFVTAKEKLWEDYGFGPWAFFIDGEFVGWGGLQPESGYPDLALVLHPNHWGIGNALYETIVRRAFDEMGFEAITVLLPQTRKRVKSLFRLGFQQYGTIEVEKKLFNRYRLENPMRVGNSH
jgi:ribosomal-protein-alanine N-acetyltransferase